MNEPLTIEELKALPLGEWVWITMETEDSYIVGYYQLIQPLYLTKTELSHLMTLRLSTILSIEQK